MERFRIGIVIPALNEAESISAVVTTARFYGQPIVVDDGSTDNTAEIAATAGAVVVRHNANRGYDKAINSGFEKAAGMGAEVIITLDADGQHDPGLIEKFIDRIADGADIVIGVRSRQQRFAERLFALYTGIRFGIRDPLCGLKAYRTEVYNELGHFDSFDSVGTELSIFGARRGYVISQVEFDVRDRVGNSRFGDVLSGNLRILRAMFQSWWRIK